MKGRSLLILLILASCSDNNVAERAPVAAMVISQTSTQFILDAGLSSDPNGNTLTYQWRSSSNLVTIKTPTSANAIIDIPSLTASQTVDITLEVSDGHLKSSTTQGVLVPSTNQMEAYGLGQTMTAGASSNTDYAWYLDQANSGPYSPVNCGPTSVTMAIHWANRNFSLTPRDARSTYRSTGGWWYSIDVINYLNLHSTKNYTVALTTVNVLKNKIDDGGIAILCLDMYYVTPQTFDAYHVNKFYTTDAAGWGHFIVIKGYKIVDGQIFYEAYDPYDFGLSYLDYSPKGKDRYYLATDLDQATNVWWDFAIVVPQHSSTNARMSIPADAVDVSAIEHKPGR